MLLWLGRSIDLKGSERTAAVIDLLSFDSEKELVAPSLQSTERRWVVARTGTLGRENRAAEATGGTAQASRCRSRRLLQLGEREERTLIDVFVQKSSSSIAIVSQGPSTVEDRGVAWGKKPLRDGSTPAVEKRDGMTETP
ncbi:hypothetical protein GW17_00048882 [Ensete ventricosum]|nr:hypothetical protein GW17_00048882 [Ensete ventricosum]